MIKYFRKAFGITNDNIILTIPLVLGLLFFSIYLGFAKATPDNVWAIILLIITILLMVAAFWAGWVFMIKKSIDLSKKEFLIDDEKSKASFDLIKEFPVGIGEFFLPALGGFLFYLVLIAIIASVVYFAGVHFIGKLSMSFIQLKLSLSNPELARKIVTSMSRADLIKLNAWNFLFLSTATIFSFITMFWSPEVIYNTKNPFKAFFFALKNTFRKPLGSLIIFVYISALNFCISLLNAFATINALIYFVSMLLYFYFFVYIVVLIFLYYDEEFAKETEDSGDNGTDSDGQDGSSDTTGEGE